MNGPSVGRVIPNAPVGYPQRNRLYHAAPPWVEPGGVFFITIACAERTTNQLARPAAFPVMTAAIEHYMKAEKLWAHLFLAMPDHLHALMSFPRQERMDSVIRNWKRFVAKNASVAWQDGFFDHRLRSNESFEEKAHYIRMNPVRARLVSEPGKWPYVWPAVDTATAR